MNSLWTRNSSLLPPCQNRFLENTTSDSCGCPSDQLFANSVYTLSFGQLLSGDFQRYQPCNPTSCLYERPVCCSTTVHKPCPTPVRSFPSNPLINSKVDEAMKNIRKTAQKPCQYSIPSVPPCYNPINQNHMTKAAGVLERAATAMSMANIRQTQYR